jgi:hypothetical protein
MELLASVRPISRDLCAKTQWIPWPDASIHRRVLTVERVTNRTERFSASFRQDLVEPGAQTMSTIVLIHPFVSTGHLHRRNQQFHLHLPRVICFLFSLFSLAIVDCCCSCAVTKEKGVKQRSIIVYWIPAKMAGLVSIVTADLFGNVLADLAATNANWKCPPG